MHAPTIPEYLERGSGQPVVLIPGLEGAREFWRFQMEPLGARYRVLATSLLRRRLDRQSRVADYADGVLRLLDRLGLERAAVVGESFGGLVAQELAIAHPGRVAALVLCNTLDRARRGNLGANWFTLATLAHPLVFLLPEAARRPYLAWVGRQHGFVMDATPGNADLADYVLVHGLAHGLQGNLDRVLAGLRQRNTGRLASIQAPTLFLRGVQDRLITDAAVAELVARIPGATLASIDGGHCCPHTCPEATNRALLGWFDAIGY